VGVDGELSELVNLIPQNGELVNVRGLEKELDIDEGLNIFCIHKPYDKTIYLCNKGRGIYYYVNGILHSVITGIGEVYSGVAIGNIVILTTDNGNGFLKWNGESYIYLGSKIPHINVKARTEMSKVENIANENGVYFNLDFDNLEGESSRTALYRLYNELMNSFGEKYFLEPFMLRYAYEMYDDSILDCSPPILIPCSKNYPSLYLEVARSSGTPNAVGKYRGYIHTLYVQAYNIEDSLQDLSDLIRNVVFYISPVKVGGDKLNTTQVAYGTYPGFNEILSSDEYKDLGNADSMFAGPSAKVWFSNENIDTAIEDASVFYLLKKIPFKSFIHKNEEGNAEEYPLNGESFAEDKDFNLHKITTNKVLKEDAPNNEIWSNYAFSYNQRIIRGDIKEWFYRDKDPASFFFYHNYEGWSKVKLSIYVEIEEDGVKRVVEISNPDTLSITPDTTRYYYDPLRYFYYPNGNAKRVSFKIESNNSTRYTLSALKQHPLMEGAYLYNEGRSILQNRGSGIQLHPSQEQFKDQGNRLSISEYSNPFLFSRLNNIYIGDGDIKGITTSAKALSEGQFGQFPIYAFCTDGVWGVEISDEGIFRSVQPISRDVCNNPDSVTQIDGAVVFTTDQGLMMIQGSEVVNLSGAMEGYNTDESIYFPEGFFAGCGKGEFDHIVVSEKRDFREILKTCTIAYDYVNQLLRIFPKREDETDSTHPYKYYVYSFTTREFASVVGSEFEVKNGESVTYNDVRTVVPDYPSSIVQIGDSLYRPAERDDNENTKKGLLLTRPIMLDEPFALKKLQDMRLHYSKFDGTSQCNVIVYVSNDGANWMQIKSLRRNAYKYYRFAIITDMKDMDALSGMVLRYETERTNKLR
jgi:hypothetical protein